jgi:diphthamide synthase (EF-2-diphthine--ammonia ligase)
MKPLLSWSNGKDSAWALHLLRQRPDVDIVGLLTTTNESYGRVAMHGVRRELLQAQADAAVLPLWEVPLPDHCTNEQYEALMSDAMRQARQEGITAVAFCDLFLDDIRRYREAKLDAASMTPLFPVWGVPTRELAAEMLAAGVVAPLSCVDPRPIPADLAGRRLDASLIAELPGSADACGKTGVPHVRVGGAERSGRATGWNYRMETSRRSSGSTTWCSRRKAFAVMARMRPETSQTMPSSKGLMLPSRM